MRGKFWARYAMTVGHCPGNWGSEGRREPPVDPGQSPDGGAGGQAPEALKILHFALS